MERIPPLLLLSFEMLMLLLLSPPWHDSGKPQLLTSGELLEAMIVESCKSLSHDVISEEPKAPPLSVLQHVPLEK